MPTCEKDGECFKMVNPRAQEFPFRFKSTQGTSPQWSLADLSLPFDSYRDLDRFHDSTLVELGLRPEDVEDVYPCSPMQEGILASQSRDPAAYRVCSVFEVVPAPNARIDCARLQQAWRAVVRRHSLAKRAKTGLIFYGGGRYILLTARGSHQLMQKKADRRALPLHRGLGSRIPRGGFGREKGAFAVVLGSAP